MGTYGEPPQGAAAKVANASPHAPPVWRDIASMDLTFTPSLADPGLSPDGCGPETLPGDLQGPVELWDAPASREKVSGPRSFPRSASRVHHPAHGHRRGPNSIASFPSKVIDWWAGRACCPAPPTEYRRHLRNFLAEGGQKGRNADF